MYAHMLWRSMRLPTWHQGLRVQCHAAQTALVPAAAAACPIVMLPMSIARSTCHAKRGCRCAGDDDAVRYVALMLWCATDSHASRTRQEALQCVRLCGVCQYP